MISKNKNREKPYSGKSHDARSKKCGHIRAWLRDIINKRLGLDARWVRNHIANCPRCHRRLVNVGKVNLALSVMKSQPHSLDLLMRANTQAIGVLKHSLRREPKAQKLRAMQPEPKLFERCRKYTHAAANVAACIAILFLMKIGVFSSVDKFQNQGQKVIEQYYAGQIGEDLANDIFT
jgi:hypothetical protein